MTLQERRDSLIARMAKRLEHLGQSDEDHRNAVEAEAIVEATNGVLSRKERLKERLIAILLEPPL